jgi:hypothetical protein
MKMHGYQNEGVIEKAFRNSLNLKGANLFVWDKTKLRTVLAGKEKREPFDCAQGKQALQM